jgi:hypothetical protein
MEFNVVMIKLLPIQIYILQAPVHSIVYLVVQQQLDKLLIALTVPREQQHLTHHMNVSINKLINSHNSLLSDYIYSDRNN